MFHEGNQAVTGSGPALDHSGVHVGDAPPGCRYVHTTSDLGLTLPHSHTFPLNPVFDCLRLRAHLTATACTAPLSFTTIIVLTSSAHWSTFHQDTVTTTTAVVSSSPTGWRTSSYWCSSIQQWSAHLPEKKCISNQSWPLTNAFFRQLALFYILDFY